MATGSPLVGASLVALVGGILVAKVSPAVAAPGELDTTFGQGGVVTTSFSQDPTDSHYGAYAYVVGVQPDGKIVAGGWAGSGGPAEFALARYGQDGDPDTTFGTDGRVTTDFTPGSDEVRALAFPADGKIIVVGVHGFVGFAIARYQPDGDLDATFSGNGKTSTRFKAGDAIANDVALLPDGKIVVVGAAGVDFGPGTAVGRFAVVRYNPDGTRDPTFSGDGMTTTNFTRSLDAAERVAIQDDGTIVVVGTARHDRKLAIARYEPDGTLDTTFSEDGRRISAFVQGATISAIAVQSDGRIVVVGFTEDLTTVALARYAPDGAPDPTFSGDGKTATELADASFIVDDVAVHSDGSIVLSGEGWGVGYDSAFTLARYHADGELDMSFGVDGFAVTDLSPYFDTAYSVAIQDDGKILAAGTAAATDFALARYLAS